MAEHMTVCGGHLTALDTSNQIFSHAKFGDVNYDNKEDCDWIIEATQGKNVHLSFLTFELEDEQDCGYDFIEVCFLTETLIFSLNLNIGLFNPISYRGGGLRGPSLADLTIAPKCMNVLI